MIRDPLPGGEIMPVSKAQQKATNKWIEKAYDRINLTVPKGRKDTIKAHAEAHSESVNGFINRAIEETMERDNGAPAGAERATEGKGDLLSAETVKSAKQAAAATGEAVPDFIRRAVDTQAQRDATSLRMGINPAGQRKPAPGGRE